MTTLPVARPMPAIRDPLPGIDPFTHKLTTGAPRHRNTVAVLKHFRYDELPEKLQPIVYQVRPLALRLPAHR